MGISNWPLLSWSLLTGKHYGFLLASGTILTTDGGYNCVKAFVACPAEIGIIAPPPAIVIVLWLSNDCVMMFHRQEDSSKMLGFTQQRDQKNNHLRWLF